MFSPDQKKELAAEFHRFMRMVSIPADRGACWQWQGNCPDARYGHFSVGTDKTVKAHRWLFALLHGPIPDELVIRHKCDNPSCVNPLHLEIGTLSDNTQDAIERGRWSDRAGERHPLVKLSETDVRLIRTKAGLGYTHRELGEQFGISRQQIGKIVRGDNWSHI